MTTPGEDIPLLQPGNALVEVRPRTLWGSAWARLAASKVAMACLMITILYLLFGVASFLPVFEYKNADNEDKGLIWDQVGGEFQPPAAWPPRLWFGTDLFGRSVLWQTIYGARVALQITIFASILAIGIGLVLGIVAGYFGGWVDTTIIWLFTTVSSVPSILLIIALVYVLEGYSNASLRPGDSADHHVSLTGHIFNGYVHVNDWLSGLLPVIIALGLTDWVGLCRLARGEVLGLRQRDFVVAARASGLGNTRILFRHILPNITHIVIITFSLGAVGYMQTEVVLSFIGLGVANRPSWGQMIDGAKVQLLNGKWWPATAATVAIFIICLALNILGDILRDALDPRLRGVN